jgi:hypothetical protein
MHDDEHVIPSSTRSIRSYVRALGTELYVLVVAGVVTGVVVVGIGSRLAMLLLRLTSPESVNGVESDDGFTIGRVTLAGSYNLLLLGAAVGVVGAAAYQWVRPRLLGPRWFGLVTLASAAGAVVGSMLVHADGIDFTLLEPMWFAVSLFVALPATFAVCIAPAVEGVERHVEAAPPVGWRRWILPMVLVAAFPLVLFVLVIATPILIVWVLVRDEPVVRDFVSTTWFGVAARGAWLSIAVLGLVALVRDIAELRSLT